MALYAGRSVAIAEVWNSGGFLSGGTSSHVAFLGDIPSTLEVFDLRVEFRVDIKFHDHPAIDNGRGRFKVWLDVGSSSSGYTQVDYKEKDLGDDSHDGDWSDSLVVKHTMVNPMESYRLRVECRTKDTSLGTSASASKYFTCTQGVNFIGDFTLDYIPLSIVYAPPGQDMTNSLSQTEEFGSQFTIGNSSGMQASQGVHAGASLWGIISVEEGVQESQSVTNTATNSLRTSYFRNTVVTADNQRAIGRAFWGPLSDLFIVMVNPKFAASKRADGTIFYEHRDCDQVIIVPAHKLLRPGSDRVASSIAEPERKKLLELDPFITNLDRFFPDIETDLKEAANPYADPSANGRAECVGTWHLSTGVELNYGIGDQIELRQGSTTEMSWSTTMRGSGAIVIGGSASAATTVGIQWSQESSRRLAKSAACYLIKNQNDPEPEGIKVYYDKIFSTLMFRKLRDDAFVLPTNKLPQIVPDLHLDLIIQKILDLLPGLGFPDIKPPKHPLRFGDVDFGIPEAFPTLPKDIVAKLVKRLKNDLVPNCSLVGSARDGENHPLFYETVELARGKMVFYRTFSDGMGKFRFDNIVPGTYSVLIGDQSKEVTVDVKNTYVKPKSVSIEKAVRLLDFKQTPRWKLKALLGVDSTAVEKLAREHGKLVDVPKIVASLGLSKEDGQALARRFKRI